MPWLTREQATLWTKREIDIGRGVKVDLDALTRAFKERRPYPPLRHCSACDHEWTGDGDCPVCGGAPF